MHTITIHGNGKVATADISTKNDEATVMNLTVFSDSGKITYYGKKECARHEWLLYKTVKNYLYE